MKQVELQDGASADVVQENMQHLKELFPDAFTENGVNFDTLRQLLGDLKVLDEGEEKYGLNWHGKKQACQIALTPSLGTLLPCPEESVDWDTTQNLFIEGDNLEVLKLLQKSYANKVKMIYIDPPYNTGNEFVYPDKFQDNLDTYLKYTGQIDGEGLKFTSNTETGGRKHTNWLNMMYPRLKLARSLLSDDGLIYSSIDSGEVANLREIMDEIFGEENFLASIVWEKRFTRSNNSKTFATLTESILCYRKSTVLETIREPRNEKADSTYSNPDNDPRGVWTSVSYVNPATKEQRPNLTYTLINPITGEKIDHPTNAWKYQKSVYEQHAAENRLYWGSEGGNKFPRLKRFLSEMDDGMVPVDFWDRKSVGTTDDASKKLQELFGMKVFDFPKPIELIVRALKLAESKDFIALDFFAGSGTTAHAVMKLNSEDGGSRRCISVQLPEIITDQKSEAFKAGYKTIAEISKERIRRAAKKIKDENPDYAGDLGFKVFKLASSNIKVWNPDRTDLEGSLLDHKEHLVEGRSEQDILYELLLKRGVDLTTPIETREIAGKNVYSIGFGKIITCLDDLIAANDVEPLAAGIIAWQKELKSALGVNVLETHVFFKDSAFRDDVAKTNMAAILSQNGIDHVRSL
ncbi:MAG: site-specific DNA-methyltransferase [Alphaproteobacteria bacterium CG_4_9_14_3_um_filter_47_13]|nr:MAG: site-specific DNA-methyltransferase [Alphaproteobacteria bacterium CG_4_9_14_3_um_filter_47_13]